MKFTTVLLALLSSATLIGQTVYTDARQFPLLGKTSAPTEYPYERIPADIKYKVRPGLRLQATCSSGLAVRFRTNSTSISVKWDVRNDNRIPLMTSIGVCGLDLYCLEGETWHFVCSAMPQEQHSEATFISNMEPREREFMMYLPLYEEATAIQIGVDSSAVLSQPAVDLPKREKPLVFYGTSIMQGGCANRPGMSHTNILGRKLQRECINLGFRGNAMLDLEIAEMMAGMDASLFVIDCLPNVYVQLLDQNMEKFYRIIREKHPKTPIIFVENPRMPTALYDMTVAKELREENVWLKAFVKKIRKEGDRQAYFFSGEKMTGTDGDASVDGCHLTDLGFMRMAEAMYPLLKKLSR